MKEGHIRCTHHDNVAGQRKTTGRTQVWGHRSQRHLAASEGKLVEFLVVGVFRIGGGGVTLWSVGATVRGIVAILCWVGLRQWLGTAGTQCQRSQFSLQEIIFHLELENCLLEFFHYAVVVLENKQAR